MAHFAEIKNGVVVNMIVAEQEWIDTQEGVEYLLSTPSNPAYVGGLYIDDKFTLPQPFASWTLDTNYDWQAPVRHPADGKIYTWDEDAQAWVEIAAG